jgi:hypothetical protein
MLELLLVYLIVFAAALYATWKFAPAALRAAAVPHVVDAWRRLGASPELTRRLEAKLASAGTCGTCDTCRACKTGTPDSPGLAGARIIPIERARGEG